MSNRNLIYNIQFLKHARYLFAAFIMITSLCLVSCSSDKEDKTKIKPSMSSPLINANQERVCKILEKLILAEKHCAVRKGYYTDIEDLKKKGLLNLDDSEMADSGYNFSVEFNGVRDFRIYANPKEYKKTGILSFYADQTSKIRGADHKGYNASPDDPEI